MVKDAAFTAVTAGFKVGDAQFGGVNDFAKQSLNIPSLYNAQGVRTAGYLSGTWAQNAAVEAFASGRAQAVIYGGSFKDNFGSAATNLVVNEGTALGFNQIGDIKDKLNLNEGSASGAFLHGVVGCLSSEASGGNCGAGFVTASVNEFASPLYDDGFITDPNATAAKQEQARKTYELQNAYLTGVLLGAATSGGDVSNVGRGSGLTTNAVQNNRQLHVDEAMNIRRYANEYAVQQGYCETAASCSDKALTQAKAELTAETLRGVSDDFADVKVNAAARDFLNGLEIAGHNVDGQTLFGVLDRNSAEYRNSFQNADQFTKVLDLYTGVTVRRGIDGGYWALNNTTQEAGYFASKSEIYGLGLGIDKLHSAYRTHGGEILNTTGGWNDELLRNEQQARGEALFEQLPLAIRKSELSWAEAWGFDPDAPEIIAQSQASSASVLAAGMDSAISIGMLRTARKIAKNRVTDQQILYHYTDANGVKGIIESETLNPSLWHIGTKDVRYGNGQYVSDISPGNRTPSQLSRDFLGIPFQGKRFTHYVEIDATGLGALQGRAGVYVIPNEIPLNLEGRLISSGKVPIK